MSDPVLSVSFFSYVLSSKKVPVPRNCRLVVSFSPLTRNIFTLRVLKFKMVVLYVISEVIPLITVGFIDGITFEG